MQRGRRPHVDDHTKAEARRRLRSASQPQELFPQPRVIERRIAGRWIPENAGERDRAQARRFPGYLANEVVNWCYEADFQNQTL